MKKTISAVLVILLIAAVFTGCGKTEATKAVEELIAGIGEVNAESGKVIGDARDAFDKLSDEEKEKVKNTSKLEAAEEKYKEISDFNADIQKILDASETSFSDAEFNVSELIKRAGEIEEEYGKMTEERKAQVKDFEKLADAKAMLIVYVENAERAAAQYVKAFNKIHVGEKFTVTAVYCIKQIRNESDEYHLFALTYKDAADKETSVYSHARCLTDVSAEAIAERPETFFADKAVTEDSDAKLSGNVELDIAKVLALISQ